MYLFSYIDFNLSKYLHTICAMNPLVNSRGYTILKLIFWSSRLYGHDDNITYEIPTLDVLIFLRQKSRKTQISKLMSLR